MNVHSVYNMYEDINMNTIRKNITLSDEDYMLIKDFAKKCGLTFSEFLRNSAIEKIDKQENMSLLEFMIKNTEFVSNEEQEDIERWIKQDNLDLDTIQGTKVSVDDLL